MGRKGRKKSTGRSCSTGKNHSIVGYRRGVGVHLDLDREKRDSVKLKKKRGAGKSVTVQHRGKGVLRPDRISPYEGGSVKRK